MWNHNAADLVDENLYVPYVSNMHIYTDLLCKCEDCRFGHSCFSFFLMLIYDRWDYNDVNEMRSEGTGDMHV
jgi:hypothetical protein